MGQLSPGSGLSGNAVRVTAALFETSCRNPLSEVSTVTWDAILVTVDGFGFGTLTGESCLKHVHCHTDRAPWDTILVTVVAFGALMWKKCAQSHRFGLGRVGGGIALGGGGVGEPRTGIIYSPPCGTVLTTPSGIYVIGLHNYERAVGF